MCLISNVCDDCDRRTTRGQRLHDLWDDFMRQLSFGGSMTPESTSALNSFSVEYCQQYGPVPEANDCSSSWRRFMPDRFLHETSPRLASCSSSSEGFSSSFSSSFSASGDGLFPPPPPLRNIFLSSFLHILFFLNPFSFSSTFWTPLDPCYRGTSFRYGLRACRHVRRNGTCYVGMLPL